MAYNDWRAANREKSAYQSQKNKATSRGVPFLLTFDEWWAIWDESGKWDQRGCRRGQYVMARFGDAGAYERGNVRICTAAENRIDWGMSLSKETRQQMSRAQKARWQENPWDIAALESARGKPASSETRQKMSHAQKIAWGKRKSRHYRWTCSV